MMWAFALSTAVAMFLVALAACPALYRRAGLSRRYPTGMTTFTVIWSSLFVPLVLCCALLVAIPFGDAAPWWSGGVLGLTLAGPTFVVGFRRIFLPRVRVDAHASALRDPERRAAAVEAIEDVVARARRPLVRLYAAGALAEARLHVAMERLLQPLIGRRLRMVEEVVLHVDLAIARLYQGDRAGARRELDVARAVKRNKLFLPLVDRLDALICALEGDGPAALERLGPSPRVGSAHRRGWLLARAHGLAAAGDEDGAREALIALRDEHGADGLARAADLQGPASSLAAALHRDADVPYR